MFDPHSWIPNARLVDFVKHVQCVVVFGIFGTRVVEAELNDVLNPDDEWCKPKTVPWKGKRQPYISGSKPQ